MFCRCLILALLSIIWLGTHNAISQIYYFDLPPFNEVVSNEDNANTTNLNAYLLISNGSNTNTIRVSLIGSSAPRILNAILEADEIRKVDLSSLYSLSENASLNRRVKTGISIETSRPVQCEVLFQTKDGRGVARYNLKGDKALGKHFILPSLATLPNYNSNQISGETNIHLEHTASIFALINGTEITIENPLNLIGFSENTPFTTILNRGESFKVAAEPGKDLQGLEIQSNLEVVVSYQEESVLSQNNVGSSDPLDADRLGDQLIPVEQWEMEYWVCPGTLLNPDNEKIHITFLDPNTSLRVNGEEVNLPTISKGSSFELSLADTCIYLESSHPIGVFQITGIQENLAGSQLLPSSCSGLQNLNLSIGPLIEERREDADCQSDLAFRELNDFIGPDRSGGVSFVLNGKAYIGLGSGESSALRDIWEYDPVGDTWSQMAFIDLGRENAGTFTIDNKAYVCYGSNNTRQEFYNDLWEFDPLNNIWTQKADFLGIPRSSGISFSIGNLGYVGGGADQNLEALSDFYVYDPALDSWASLNNLPASMGKIEPSIINFPNTALVVGGEIAELDISQQTWQYIPNNDTWVRKEDFPGAARLGALSWTIANSGYIGLGLQRGLLPFRDFWKYNLANDTWEFLGDFCFAGGLSSGLAFVLDETAFFGTGIVQGASISSFWKFNDPNLDTSNTFTRETNFSGGARLNAMSFSLGGKGYVGAGENASGISVNDFWEYDPILDSWTQIADLPNAPRERGATFVIGDKAYAGLGFTNAAGSRELWEYDPSQNNWTQKANFPGIGRELTFSFSHEGLGYVGGGQQLDGVPLFDMYAYDPQTDTWERKADYPSTGPAATASFKIGEIAYVQGGGTSSLNFNNELWAYDFAQDTWEQKNSLPLALGRTTHIGFALSGKGYIAFGHDSNLDFLNDFWEYDPQEDSWAFLSNYYGNSLRALVSFVIGDSAYFGTGLIDAPGRTVSDEFWIFDPKQENTVVLTSFPCDSKYLFTQIADYGGLARFDAVSFSLGGKGYVGLGEISAGILSNDFWEYDPATNSWMQIADFPGPLRRKAASFTIQDKAYIVGGVVDPQINLTYFKDNWEYSSTSNSWTSKAVFEGFPRYDAFSFSLQGIGYVGTGITPDNRNSNDCYAYDPNRDTWEEIAPFTGSGTSGARAFSIDTLAYVYGGNEATGNEFLDNLYQYDPSSDSWTPKNNLPGEDRVNHIAFSLAGKGYIGLGSNGGPGTDGEGQYLNNFWEYDPSLDTWRSLGEFCGDSLSSAVSFVIGDSAYFGTGFSGTSSLVYRKDFWRFTPLSLPTSQLTLLTRKENISFFQTSPIPSLIKAEDFQDVSINGQTWSVASLSLDSYLDEQDIQSLQVSLNNGSYFQASILESIEGNASFSQFTQSIQEEDLFNNLNVQILCSDSVTTLVPREGFDNYTWSTGETTKDIIVDQPGTYTLMANRLDVNCMQVDSIVVDLLTLQDSDTTLKDCLDEPLLLSARDNFDTYLWSTGESTPSISVDQEGKYVVVLTQDGCQTTETFQVDRVIDRNFTQSICPNTSLTLDAEEGYDSYAWSTGDNSQFTVVNQAGIYEVIVSKGECQSTLTYIVVAEDFNDTTSQLTLCPNEALLLDIGTNYDAYAWSTGETTPTITVSEIGSYTAQITQGECQFVAEFLVSDLEFNINAEDNISLCKGTPFLISATSGFDTYQWNTGEASSSISVINTGWYLVNAQKEGCSYTDSVFVQFDERDVVDLGPDTLSCQTAPLTLRSPEGVIARTWSDGSNGPELLVTQTGTYWLEVQNACGISRDEIYIEFASSLDIIPNVITPNLDGLNDTFVIGDYKEKVKIKIFNRYGKAIYFSQDYKNSWDAENLSPGIYFYSLHVPCYEPVKGWIKVIK